MPENDHGSYESENDYGSHEEDSNKSAELRSVQNGQSRSSGLAGRCLWCREV